MTGTGAEWKTQTVTEWGRMLQADPRTADTVAGIVPIIGALGPLVGVDTSADAVTGAAADLSETHDVLEAAVELWHQASGRV